MSGTRITAVIVLLLALGIALLVSLHRPPAYGPVAKVLPPFSRLAPVELVDFYDKDSTFDAPGCWQAVPRGDQTFGHIPFRIAGLIELWGEGPGTIGRNYRQSVEGIPVRGKFQSLYVLHGSSFITPNGTPIAQVVLHYADGTKATNFIRYGDDSRDWWEPLSEHNPLPTNSPSQIVWRGDHPSLPDWVKSLRLFGTAIPNPKPDSEVQGVDLVSTRSRTTWVVLALTTGPSGAMRVDPQFEENESAGEPIAMKLTTLDAETGKPVPGTQYRVTLTAGRRPRPYGFFSSDEHGECTVELPPGHLKLLAIEASSSNYTPEQMTWNLEKGETIPTNYVFRISKDAQ